MFIFLFACPAHIVLRLGVRGLLVHHLDARGLLFFRLNVASLSFASPMLEAFLSFASLMPKNSLLPRGGGLLIPSKGPRSQPATKGTKQAKGTSAMTPTKMKDVVAVAMHV